MENPRSLANRIDVLEQQLLQVRHAQNNPLSRFGNVAPPLQVRLVKTVSDSGGGSYPSAGADTFGIIFVDGSYTKSAGTQAHTFTLRKSTPAVDVAHSINGKYYPVNTYAWVVRQNHHWWFLEDIGQKVAPFLEFTLPSALAVTDASKASCPVVAYWGGYSPGSTVTVYNYADVAGDYQWSGDNGAHGYAQWDDVLARYRIYDLNCPS